MTTNVDTSAKCNTTTLVPIVIIMIGLTRITLPNAFPDSLFINLLCAHDVFEKSTDREWHNPMELLLTAGVICWNKVACMLATQKQEELSVNY